MMRDKLFVVRGRNVEAIRQFGRMVRTWATSAEWTMEERTGEADREAEEDYAALFARGIIIEPIL